MEESRGEAGLQLEPQGQAAPDSPIQIPAVGTYQYKINGVEGRAERILGHELLIESRIHDKFLWISDLLGKKIQRNINQDVSYENYVVVVLYDEMGLRLLARSHW